MAIVFLITVTKCDKWKLTIRGEICESRVPYGGERMTEAQKESMIDVHSGFLLSFH